jgi:hypothetical protein
MAGLWGSMFVGVEGRKGARSWVKKVTGFEL